MFWVKSHLEWSLRARLTMVKHESVVGSPFLESSWLFNVLFSNLPNPLIPSLYSASPFCSGPLSFASHLHAFLSPNKTLSFELYKGTKKCCGINMTSQNITILSILFPPTQILSLSSPFNCNSLRWEVPISCLTQVVAFFTEIPYHNCKCWC